MNEEVEPSFTTIDFENFVSEPLVVQAEPMASQLAACERLKQFAETFFQEPWQTLPIKPRLRPLLVGPTGAGKSWLVNYVVVKTKPPFKVPVMRVTLGDWIIIASRPSRGHTLAELQKFVSANNFGVIHIDELDKFNGHSEWMQDVIQEVFSICDGCPVQAYNSTWSDTQRERLKNHFFIVGSGTWQTLWEKPGQLGFHENEKKTQFLDRVRVQKTIPPELFRRFNEDLISLSYPSREDVVQIIAQLKTKLPLELGLGLEDCVDEIVASQKGIRWFEEFFARRLMQIRKEKQKNK